MRRLLVAFLLAGCSVSNSPTTSRPTYPPIPDVALFARIGHIPGVVGVDIGWVDRFGESSSYVGDVDIDRRADQARVLDQAIAILRQGRQNAFMAIQVFRPGSYAVAPADFGLRSLADYEARYGPQPGTGRAPPTPLTRGGDPGNTPRS